MWMVAGEGATPKPGELVNQFVTSNNDVDTRHGDYDGDLMPGDPGAIPSGGGQGPLGNTVDGIGCAASMSTDPAAYHVHAFIGLYVNGTLVDIPDAIGIVNAGGDMTDSNGWPNQEVYGTCFYNIHTHDNTGLIHLEQPTVSGTPKTASIYTLGEFFDIWGIQVTPTQFGPLQGPLTVYTSGQTYRGGCTGVATTPWQCEIGDSEYSLWTGDPHDIPLYSHEAIWIEVGSGNPDAQHLPGVSFATEY